MLGGDRDCDGGSEYRLVLEGPGGGPLSIRCEPLQAVDDVPLDDAPMRALEALNRRCCFTPGPFVMVHAGAVAQDDRAVVLTAGSGGGKSTLVAGLVRAGWAYLSDESAAIGDRGLVHPYTRPIALLPGSWPLFPGLEVELPVGSDRFARQAWHVPADRLGAVASDPAAAVVVVDLRFEPGAPTGVRPLTRGEGMERLALLGLNLRTFGQGGLERVAAAVRGSRCYELQYGDLDAGIEAVASLV